jgi:hypothetical protein
MPETRPNGLLRSTGMKTQRHPLGQGEKAWISQTGFERFVWSIRDRSSRLRQKPGSRRASWHGWRGGSRCPPWKTWRSSLRSCACPSTNSFSETRARYQPVWRRRPLRLRALAGTLPTLEVGPGLTESVIAAGPRQSKSARDGTMSRLRTLRTDAHPKPAWSRAILFVRLKIREIPSRVKRSIREPCFQSRPQGFEAVPSATDNATLPGLPGSARPRCGPFRPLGEDAEASRVAEPLRASA